MALITVGSALSGCRTVDLSATCTFSDELFIEAAAEDVRVWVWAPEEWLTQAPFLSVDIESPRGTESPQGTTETFMQRLARTDDMAAPSSSGNCSEAGEPLMFEDAARASEMWALFGPSDEPRQFSFRLGFPSLRTGSPAARPDGTMWIPVKQFGFAVLDKARENTLVACGCASRRR